MRVLMVDPLFSTPPYDELLCSALTRAGHEVVFAARRFGPGESWRVPDVPYVPLDLVNVLKPSRPTKIPKRLVTLARHVRYGLYLQRLVTIAREIKPDVIHLQWCLTPIAERLLLRLLPKTIPVIYTMHDTNPFNGGQVSMLLTLGLDALLPRFDRIIVHTKSAIATLSQKGLDPAKLRRVAHGPLQIVKADTGVTNLGNPQDNRVQFLLFGIMKPYKGIDTLIKAVAALSEDVRQKCVFKVAGMPEMDLAPLTAAINEQGLENAIQLDARYIPDHDMQALFAEADVNLFPYKAIEASGVFTIAIQFAKPVIASAIGLFKEAVEHGKNGLLFEPGDHKALAAAITHLTIRPDERMRMGAAMASVFAQYPDWDAVAEATLTVYRECMDKHPT